VLIWDGTLFVVAMALAFDALIGDPDWIWQRLPHPVVLIGEVIGWLDRRLNHEHRPPEQRKIAGAVATILLVAAAALVGVFIQMALQSAPGGKVALGLVASMLIAQRSLYQHVDRVRSAFAEEDGLAAAREEVALIVGRDPEQLDQAGVCRAAIESCAENFSDGIVAPVFWLALLGLPGLIVYKAINTADSMIGHHSERYEAFGWAAARLDDWANFVPARLAGLLLAIVAPLAGGSIAASLKVMRRDAPSHRSPNAGWPEGAMAGALGLALAGPRHYADGVVDDPFLNADGDANATPDDIGRALDLYFAACALEGASYAALALVA
jgi:adenosylcobinamide-phosphate synthase